MYRKKDVRNPIYYRQAYKNHFAWSLFKQCKDLLCKIYLYVLILCHKMLICINSQVCKLVKVSSCVPDYLFLPKDSAATVCGNL
jgi:hypothetical protein